MNEPRPAMISARPPDRRSSVANSYQVAVNYRKADVTPRQKAMLDFAIKVAGRSHDIEEMDYEALKQHGFSDDDAWDIAAIAALFAMSNRLANAFSIRPNEEFYTMGRESRG